MHADYEKLMGDYQDTSGILIASAQCQKDDGSDGSGAAICDRLMDKCTNEPGYPTLCYGDGDKDLKLTEYTGDHSYAAMKKFVEKHLGPAANSVAV